MKHRIFSLSNTLKDGFFLILPLGITLWLIYSAWVFLRKLLPDLSNILPQQWLVFPYLYHILDVIFLVVIILLIIVTGMIASTFLGKIFHRFIEKLLISQTFISPIYKTFQKVAEMFFKKDDNDTLNLKLSESIIIPYPNEHTKSIGFITSHNANHIFGEEEGNNWLTVYLPSAPLVSAGFYLICKKEDTEKCLLSSSSAITTIISVGSIQSQPLEVNNTPLPIKKSNPLKVWFFNGLLFLTPVVSTLAILHWVFNYLFKFIFGIINLLPPILITIIPIQYYTPILSLCLIIILLILTFIIGFIGESAFGLWIKSLAERIFHSIPMFNTIYSIVTQITHVFSPDPSKNSTFSQAVLVPFPTEKTYAVGFITGTHCASIKPDKGEDYIPVFIPTTPIPTTGWFLLVPKTVLIPLDMPIEQAFGLVISGGILTENKE